MSETLQVEPNQLDGAADQLRKLAEDNTHTDTYLKKWLDLPSSEGGLVLQGVIGVIQETLSKLQSNYERLGRVTNESAEETTNAAKMYRTTDYGVASALDQAYAPGSGK